MKKLFVSFIVILFAVSVNLNAQEKVQTKKEAEKKECSAHDHSKMTKEKAEAKETESHCSAVGEAGNCCDKKDAKAQVKASTKTWNSVCPIMGGEVDPEVQTASYQGKTIGFCCDGCIEKFNKDPEKYIKQFDKDGKKFTKA